jgi:hypothetical protein
MMALRGEENIVMTEIENKVVVHFRDGRVLKGYTYDFNPNKEVFHVTKTQNGTEVVEISTSQMKALFFVKSFEGNRRHPGPDEFSMEGYKNSPGIKVKVTFLDEEVMYGSTHGYAPNRKGFFISPANKDLNNKRVFVVKESTAAVETWRWGRPTKNTKSAPLMFTDSPSLSAH